MQSTDISNDTEDKSVPLHEKTEKLQQELEDNIKDALTIKDIEALRVQYLGRKHGKIPLLLKEIPLVAVEKRAESGALLNTLKKSAEKLITDRIRHINNLESRDVLDVTLPGTRPAIGTVHPVTKTIEEIKAIFVGLGFEVVVGPELETEYYNFEALNMPRYHPARDEQDSFYINDSLLLRTQTSPVQVRVMEHSEPPIRVISPGRCFRRDATDASHFPVFHQIEGLAVDEGITFADLKGCLNHFVQRMFGTATRLRFRPSYFPFTEPSAEVDISCLICGGKGCRVCSNKGWLEILGSGMVEPEVFTKIGYDPERYQGFAFGLGVERICLLKHGIDDIRLFFQNDIRFLRQF